MKSRTSSFNLTVFKKDLTRFAPCWGAYLIFLLLVMVSLAGNSAAYYRVQNITDAAIQATAVLNLIYAPVVAHLLFGDLYNSRLCNALHALPVTRESWFATHVASGFVFSAVPNLLTALLALPVLRLEAGWSVVFWWLLAAELQYVFFFGVAVLCVMLSGNRLGQLALYAMINFVSMLAGWLAVSIYEPLLYGIQIDSEAFVPYSPVAQMGIMDNMLIIDAQRIEDNLGRYIRHDIYGINPGEGWGYTALCAGLGILALLAALALYRKRKLECAGDFVAFSRMEPVVVVLVTIFAGGVFHLFGDVFGMDIAYVLLFTGMIVGFFACQMLMKRTTRVFQKKAFLGCGTVVAVFALTLVLTHYDVAGITRYVPDADEIQNVRFSTGYSLYRHEDFPFTATEMQDIEAILSVHEDCLDRTVAYADSDPESRYNTVNLRLEYTLKDGKTVNRFYDVHPQTEAGQILKSYFTRTECVLGFPAEDVPKLADSIYHVCFSGGKEREELEDLDLDGMLRAIAADCEAGNMARSAGFHYPTNYDFYYDIPDEEFDDQIAFIEIGWDREGMNTSTWSRTDYGGTIYYSNIVVYRSCENTLRWLEENGLLSEDEQKELAVSTK